MFVAHLPAGYLLTKGLQYVSGVRSRAYLPAGLVASVLPDIDLLYFYLVDDRKTSHHHYVTHLPMFWLTLALAAWGLLWATGKSRHAFLIGVVLANVMLHLALDSVAASVSWLYPFSPLDVNLVHVPARYNWWVWNFILHWTFFFEIALILAAAVVWRQVRLKEQRLTSRSRHTDPARDGNGVGGPPVGTRAGP